MQTKATQRGEQTGETAGRLWRAASATETFQPQTKHDVLPLPSPYVHTIRKGNARDFGVEAKAGHTSKPYESGPYSDNDKAQRLPTTILAHVMLVYRAIFVSLCRMRPSRYFPQPLQYLILSLIAPSLVVSSGSTTTCVTPTCRERATCEIRR